VRVKSLNGLLAILLAISIILPLLVSVVIAKPVEPNPATSWPSGTIWGTRLRLENSTYAGDAWFGVKTGSSVKLLAPPPGADYMRPVFVEGASQYFTVDYQQVAAPQSYSWYVKLDRGGAASTNGAVSCDIENAEAWFVPQDFSVVLDNSAQDILVNLREENGYITGIPKYATLYIDNAVSVTISPSSQSGSAGENLDYEVTVQNTGRYDDTYALHVDAGSWSHIISPSSLSVNAGGNATATLTVTFGAGSQAIIVIADGAYANDNTSYTVTATGAEQYDLTVNVDPPGSGSVILDPAGGTYEEGTDVTATANPAPGYEFDHWSDDASGTSTSVTITMNSEKNITANFRSAGEGEAREELPWTWIGVGILIIVIITVAAVATTRGR